MFAGGQLMVMDNKAVVIGKAIAHDVFAHQPTSVWQRGLRVCVPSGLTWKGPGQ